MHKISGHVRALSQFVVHLTKKGTSPDFSRGRNIALRNANTFTLLSALVSSTYVLSGLLSGEYLLLSISVSSFLCFLGSYVLLSNRKFRAGYLLYFVSVNLSIFFTNDMIGKEHLNYFYFFATLTIPFLVFEKEEGWLILICSSLGLLGWVSSYLLPTHFILPPVIETSYYSPLVPVITTPIILLIIIRQTQTLYHKTLEELEVSRLELIQAAKLASIGEFAGGLAHEINNPLAIIEGHSSIARKKIESKNYDTTAVTEHLLKVESTVRKIAKIIAGLRSFARIDKQLEREVIKTKWLVEYALDMCGERIKSMGIKIDTEQIEDREILARPLQLTQVLVNLLNNAADAILPLPEKWISIKCHQVGSFFHIEIMDSGPGIPSEIAQKMMQPFFTTKELGKGTGLGLAISKGLIEDHGGAFFYDSSSVNTKFVIQLPTEEIPSKKVA